MNISVIRENHPRIVGIALIGAFATFSVFAPAPAQAVNRYTIQANSPKPAACDNHGTIPAGTWLQNKPCGYFIGTALKGTSFDVHQTTPSNYHYGRSYGGNNLCAWIPPGAVGARPTGTAAASCGPEVRERMSHRRSFGHDFDAPPHATGHGHGIVVNTGCQAFHNYYSSSTYDGGALRDPAGTPSASVQYRFTTNGAKPAIVVRDERLGWVFLDRSCVTDWRGIRFDDSND
jgi:hypothetical protein